MATTSLPKDPKALTAMVERLLSEAEERDAAQALQDQEHAAALERAKARVAEAEDRAARAVATAEQMTANRDHWLARVERAETLVATSLDALRGIEPEPVTEEDPNRG